MDTLRPRKKELEDYLLGIGMPAKPPAATQASHLCIQA